MGARPRVFVCAAGALTAVGLALTSTDLVPPAATAASGALHPTDYGFHGHAYGTRVVSGVAGLESSRTAYSWISCTRIAGLDRSESLADVTLPDKNNPYITVDSVKSHNRTFRNLRKDIAAGFESTNSIGAVHLGGSSTPQLSFQGLRTVSRAWATTGGALKARNTFTAGDMALTNLPSGTPQPVQDLATALTQGINQVVSTLKANGGDIAIPSLGDVHVGLDKHSVTTHHADARAVILRVRLYGADGTAGGGDDARITIGRSWARIEKNVPAAVMSGAGYGASASVLDGVIGIGKLGEQVLPCPGTHGHVLAAPTAGVAPDGAPFSLGAVRGQVYGKQHKNGSSEAWTDGTLADVKLGPIELRGIRGKVNLAQDGKGRMVRNDFKGSSIGELLVDGKSMGGFKPGDAKQVPTSQLPSNIASIQLFKKTKHKRSASISAVVVTFADTTPGYTELRLGNAHAALKRY